ncbi:uncharacterized protein EAE98_008881 [Botrytis deweyae]|uniref:Uncharacterized protein n=1 Tax=Botrytis deweyae TaxID=2478750 RepID=A0ABQ7IDQ3_9HELO|nr:uncharacterized protein EAE98_008881 [Botrytis deweyae]KAF7920852.1 hypothetical protein EAE98_008881 [Botrytis deweyae]
MLIDLVRWSIEKTSPSHSSSVIAIMPNKKHKKPFRVYEDHDATKPEYCTGGFLCSLCFKDSTTLGPCTACCKGCPNCGTLLSESLKQEQGALNEDEVLHLTKSESTTNSLLQIPSNGESLTTKASSQSISTRDATKSSSSPPCYICEHGVSPDNGNQTYTPTTSIRSQHVSKNNSPALHGRHSEFHSPISQQQISPYVSPRAMPNNQSFRNSKSLSLTGSQDSLIPISPAGTHTGQHRSPKASQYGVRTHADKLRAALACPVDELPQIKYKPSKRTPLRKKIGLLLRRVRYKFEKPLVTSNHQLIKSSDDDLK